LANAWATSSKAMKVNKLRQQRKKEHLLLARRGARCSFASLFSDIRLPHNCLTEVNPHDVDLRATLCGYSVAAPLYLNAMTGGTLAAEHVNRQLARAAAKFNLPIAVGSQSSGLRSRGLRFTYQVVRKYNPHGLIMANLSAHASLREARAAVEMLEAQILQLHLNPVQEFIMPEGECIPPGLVDNIADICAGLSVPVLVKEVGFGIGSAQAKILAAAGVKAIDVSGSGGTNFARIEGRRNASTWWKPLADWGLPTPLCLIDLAVNASDLEYLASGGVDDGIRALKCLALGAGAVGIAGAVLRALPAGVEDFLSAYLRQLRVGMALLGAAAVADLRTIPLYITGTLRDLALARGIDPAFFGTRGG